jgi:hypothetical protein
MSSNAGDGGLETVRMGLLMISGDRLSQALFPIPLPLLLREKLKNGV